MFLDYYKQFRFDIVLSKLGFLLLFGGMQLKHVLLHILGGGIGHEAWLHL